MDFIEDVGEPNVVVHLDTYHMVRCGSPHHVTPSPPLLHAPIDGNAPTSIRTLE